MRCAARMYVLWIALFAITAACEEGADEALGSGAPGDPAGQSGTEGSVLSCGLRDSERAISANEAVNGITPAQLAASAQGTYDVALIWYGRPHAESIVPEPHNTSGRIELVMDLARAREVHWRTNGSDEACPRSIEIPSTLALRSADATFDELLPATVTGTPGAALASATRSPADFTGSYGAASFEGRTLTLTLTTHFRSGQSTGRTLSDGHAFLCPTVPGATCALILLW